MDYRSRIIELLDKADEKVLKVIYELLIRIR